MKARFKRKIFLYALASVIFAVFCFLGALRQWLNTPANPSFDKIAASVTVIGIGYLCLVTIKFLLETLKK